MVSVEYSEAVVEVLGILQELEESDFNKIPTKIIKFFEDNKSTTYYPDIDYTDEVENLKLREKTKEILAGLYVDYLCPENEKEKYLEKLKQNEIKYQEKLKEKYNVDNIFKSKKIENNVQNNNNSLVTIRKENIFIKFINKIKEILNFKKQNY